MTQYRTIRIGLTLLGTLMVLLLLIITSILYRNSQLEINNYSQTLISRKYPRANIYPHPSREKSFVVMLPKTHFNQTINYKDYNLSDEKLNQHVSQILVIKIGRSLLRKPIIIETKRIYPIKLDKPIEFELANPLGS